MDMLHVCIAKPIGWKDLIEEDRKKWIEGCLVWGAGSKEYLVGALLDSNSVGVKIKRADLAWIEEVDPEFIESDTIVKEITKEEAFKILGNTRVIDGTKHLEAWKTLETFYSDVPQVLLLMVC